MLPDFFLRTLRTQWTLLTIPVKHSYRFMRLKEKQGTGVIAFLRQFIFQSFYGFLEKECDKKLICPFCPNLPQGIDIFRTVFQLDYQKGMSGP